MSRTSRSAGTSGSSCRRFRPSSAALVPTESLRAERSAFGDEVSMDAVPELDARLDEPLLTQIAVGAGSAVFVKGRCAPPAGRRLGRLAIALGGDEHPLMAGGISDRRFGRKGDMWWGIVPLAAIAGPVDLPLTLRAEL